jgi:hypothetical protein
MSSTNIPWVVGLLRRSWLSFCCLVYPTKGMNELIDFFVVLLRADDGVECDDRELSCCQCNCNVREMSFTLIRNVKCFEFLNLVYSSARSERSTVAVTDVTASLFDFLVIRPRHKIPRAYVGSYCPRKMVDRERGAQMRNSTFNTFNF